MSLYTNVFWTKRISVILLIVLILCGGYNIFNYTVNNFSIKTTGQVVENPESAFGALDKINVTPVTVPADFKPNFVISTLTGSLDTDNGYPLESTTNALANVYKILDKPQDLNTTEIPRNIAKNLHFSADPISSTSSVFRWTEGTKDLTVDGQYLLIDYKNTSINNQVINTSAPLNVNGSSSDSIKTIYSSVLQGIGVTTDLTNYNFKATYLNYNPIIKDFIVADSSQTGKFVRIDGIRFYPNLYKNNAKATTNAVYPGYLFSNNYVILPNEQSALSNPALSIASLGLHNWPIDETLVSTNRFLSTYSIKTPKQAYSEIDSKYLVSFLEWDSHKYVDPIQLSGINRVDLFRVNVDMYEYVLNLNYIQPVYIFICQGQKNGQKYELVYMVPAITYTTN